MGRKKIDRIGEVKYNNFGSKMIIIKYYNCDNINVFFPEYNWIAKNTQYNEFKNGKIACPYERRLYNVGYIGEGEYKGWENRKSTRCYSIWSHMITRCYSKKYQIERPTYTDCEVCEEWHNFQNFAKWYEENYYECNNEEMHLDKDILVKGNKVYSPQTCVFVPQKINSLFVKRNKLRGNLPIGVTKCKSNNKYVSQCKHIRLGYFYTPHEAFLMYKLNKELIIQSVAEEYKDKIPNKLYETLMNYKVEEND